MEPNIALHFAPIFDIEGAKNYLASLPSGATRESLISAVATRLAVHGDPTVTEWLAAFTAPAEQALATRAVENAAPIGIGALLTARDGYPVVTGIVGAGSAALEDKWPRYQTGGQSDQW